MATALTRCEVICPHHPCQSRHLIREGEGWGAREAGHEEEAEGGWANAGWGIPSHRRSLMELQWKQELHGRQRGNSRLKDCQISILCIWQETRGRQQASRVNLQRFVGASLEGVRKDWRGCGARERRDDNGGIKY